MQYMDELRRMTQAKQSVSTLYDVVRCSKLVEDNVDMIVHVHMNCEETMHIVTSVTSEVLHLKKPYSVDVGFLLRA